MSLLEGALLRKLAAPLRRRVPGICGTLNRLRGRLVWRGGPLSPGQALALRKFRGTCLGGAPASHDVLELGSDLGLEVLEQITALGVRSAIGVNSSERFWREQPERSSGGRTWSAC